MGYYSLPMLSALFCATYKDSLVKFSLSIANWEVADKKDPLDDVVNCLNLLYGVGAMELPWQQDGTSWVATLRSPGWEEKWQCDFEDNSMVGNRYSYSIIRPGLPAEVIQELH